MANKRDYGFKEEKFKPGQREAALLLVQREFTDKGEKRKTLEEIATEVGVTRMTLYNWDTRDSNFIRYKRFLSDDFMDTKVSFVYGRLLDSVNNGSIKAIELYMKRMGDLQTKQELTINNGEGDDKSAEERRQALESRLAQLGEEEEETEG